LNDTNIVGLEKEFLKIIRENQGIVHKVCSVYCNDEEDRNDLFQEILAQLWKSFSSFRNESKISTWMYRVALNTAITSYRKSKKHQGFARLTIENLQIAEDTQPQDISENIALLRKAVERLTGIEKSIILLFLEDKSYEDIADITGITQNYVRVKMNRIKKKLRLLMTSEE
jgi:RNA polymerase sigma-70 factor (ECF subfamily)